MTKEGLKIVGFNQKKLIKQDPRVTDFYARLTSATPLADLTCCREIHTKTEPFVDIQMENDFLSDTMSESELFDIEKLCNGLFTEDGGDTLNSEGNSLDDIFEKLTFCNNSQANQLPADLDVK